MTLPFNRVSTILALFAFSFFTSCTTSKAPLTEQEKMKLKKENALMEVKNEPDQTDVFAVPLDNSEEEEEVESQKLEHMQEKIQERRKKKQEMKQKMKESKKGKNTSSGS